MTGARTRYAQVGLGLRSWIYSGAMVTQYADRAELVALCDSNPGRLAERCEWARSQGADAVSYGAEEFDRMLEERRPDCVVVTTPDREHDAAICRALEAGCDVITEKPMTIDAARCQRILDAQRASGRRCTVTFNYRYSPPRLQVKEMLAAGVVGDVVSVDFHWLLDTTHGADYFRRWHRERDTSGGLLVHKATHHFDLLNWWLDTVPEWVFATAQRRFYTPEQAERLGLGDRGERCLDCPAAERCPFRLDLREAKLLEAIYLRHEAHDGYHRDRCVFSADIDIDDAMSLVARYRNGAQLSYSLQAFSPWEGYAVAFNGTRGRLEHAWRERVIGPDGAPVPGEGEAMWTRLCPHFEAPVTVPVAWGEGGHGGGDRLLLEHLFGGTGDPTGADPLRRAADHRAGAWSLLTGVAANRSIAEGRPIRIDELVTGLDAPS